MATPLSEIIADPDYMALSAPEKVKVRRSYFDKAVATDPDFQSLSGKDKMEVKSRIIGSEPIKTTSPFGVEDLEALDKLADDAIKIAKPTGFPGVSRQPSGQLTLEAPTPGGDIPLLGSPARATAAGVRNLAVGVATLPFDIAESLGSETAQKIARGIRQNVPEIKTGTTVEGITSALVQFGLPGVAAIKLVGRMAAGIPTAIRYGLTLLTAGGADFVSSTSEEGTIGDIIGGPTQTSPGEIALSRRAKIGAEGAVVPAILDPVLGVGRAGLRGLGFLAPEATARRVVARTMQETAVDPQRAIRNIESGLSVARQGGFQPTAGTLSDDPGLIGLERGLATQGQTSPAMTARREANVRAVSDQLESVVGDVRSAADPEAAARIIRGQVEAPIAKAKGAVEVSERQLSEATQETDNLIVDFASQARLKTPASLEIDANLRSELNRLTASKNKLYESIDPERTVVIDKKNLSDAYSDAVKSRGPLDDTPGKLPKGIMGRISKVLKPEGRLTFGDLADLRPQLSDAIAQARAANEGAVVPRLQRIKDVIDIEARSLEDAGGAAGEAAREANDFFKTQYMPKFKKGMGDSFRRAIRSGKEIPPSATAQKFLQPRPGVLESSAQIKKIAEESTDAARASMAIRDYIIGDVAALMQKTDGKTSLSRLVKYINDPNVKSMIDQFPAVKKELESFRNDLALRKTKESALSQDVAQRKDALGLTEREAQKSAARFFVDSEPVMAVGRAIDGKNSFLDMKELVDLAAKDGTGEAKAGLRAAVNEYIDRTTRSTSKEVGGRLEILQSRVTKLLQNTEKRKALQLLYSKEEMDVLDRVQDELRLMDRINRQVTTGSPTAALQEARTGIRVVLASYYGIVRGRGVFFISEKIMNFLGKNPVTIGTEILREAMLNPELAVTLLRKNVGTAKVAAERKILTFLANNVDIGDDNREQQRAPLPGR